jgi:hypothetical protein
MSHFSKSIVEEIVGILWLILASQLAFHSVAWWLATVMGAISLIGSVSYAVRDVFIRIKGKTDERISDDQR